MTHKYRITTHTIDTKYLCAILNSETNDEIIIDIMRVNVLNKMIIKHYQIKLKIKRFDKNGGFGLLIICGMLFNEASN